MGRPLFALILAVSLITPTAIQAQQVDGNLEGRVLDSEGQPLADAQIAVSGPSVQGTRTSITDRSGRFRLFAVPVGGHVLRVSHVAHQPATFEDVHVTLGATNDLGDLRLVAAIVPLQKIVVSGRQTRVDPSTTSLGTTFGARAIDALPTDRDFRSVVALVPEANAAAPGEETSVAGSSGEGNFYFVDGTDVTDPSIAGTSVALPYNFVRAVEIKTGGYDAEYGRALGGIVNVITPSGGNEVHGEVFSYYTSGRLTATSRNDLLETSGGGFNAYDIGGSVGGPLLQDRLWFFAAYNPAYDNRDLTVPGLALQRETVRGHRLAAKLTWQAAPRTNLFLNVLGDPATSRIVGVPYDLASPPSLVLNEDAIVADKKTGGTTVSLHATHQPSSRMLLKSSLSTVHNRMSVTPISALGEDEPYFDDQYSGTASGGYGAVNDNRQRRWAARTSASAFLDRHTLKAGFEYTDNAITHDIQYGAGQSHGGFLYRTDDSTYLWYQGYQLGTVHVRVPTVYAQDSWRVTDQVRLNAGVRWDGNSFVNDAGNTVLRVTDGVQPRLGMTWQPDARGAQKVFASYGRFNEQLPTVSPGYYFFDSQQLFLAYDHDPRVDPTGADSTALLPSAPGGGRVKGQYFDEYSFGYERALADGYKVGARARYRRLGRVIEDAYSVAEDRFIIGNPGEGDLAFLPEATQEYKGLEMRLERATDRGEFLASYVLSRTNGNYAGLEYGNAGPQFDFVETTANAAGLLPNDRTHVLKFYGAYRTTWGLTSGASWTWMSGTPLNELGGIPNLPYTSFLAARGSVGRTPSLWDMNLRLAYRVQNVSNAMRPRFILDLFHVFSQRRPIRLDERRYFGADEDGNQIGLNPNYLEPLLYQPPFGARLGVSMDF